jgi:hypothetical protein
MMIPHRAEAEMEEVAERKDIGRHAPPTTDTPEKRQAKGRIRRLGKPKSQAIACKIDHRGITYACYSVRACRRHKLERGRIMRRTNVVGANIREPTQQLKQAQLAIAELYQENRELRQQLAAKTLEVSASQGHEGKVTWLKRQLREAQDTIVQLREAHRTSEEQNVKQL